MKKICEKLLVFIFVAFLSLSMILTAFVNYNGIIGSLYENKEQLFDYKTSFQTISSAYGENLYMQKEYSDIYGSIQSIQGKNAVWGQSVSNPYVVGSDGKLYNMSVFPQKESREELETEYSTIAECASRISDLAEKVTENKGKFLFVQAPERYNYDYVKLPLPQAKPQIDRIETIDKYLLSDSNVHILNLQKEFFDDGIDYKSMFFKTDHHWTIKTAFKAYQKICETINTDFGIEIDKKYFLEDSWNFKTQKNSFLGSLGGRVGAGFIGKDDIDYVFPKFKTKYTKKVSRVPQISIANGGSVDLKGEYTKAILNVNSSDVIYGIYVHPDVAEVLIKNELINNKKKILIIKDSFALPISAFLSTCFSETRMIDPRYYKDGILNYIDNYNPDVVLLVCNPSSYNFDFLSFD